MDTKTFEIEVLQASRQVPIVVDFWAPWCAPCRVLGPVLEKLEKAAAGRWRLVKVNTEEAPDVAMRYQVSSIPDVRLFRDGQVVADFHGALPESQVQRWLDTHVGSPSKAKLEAGIAALKAGDEAAGQALLREVLKENPDQHEARIPLAESLFKTDAAAAIELVKDVHLGDPLWEHVEALRELNRLSHFDDTTVNTGSRGWPSYQEGIAAWNRRDYNAALEHWIATIKADRKLDEDGARRACVALFRWLGEDHPATREHRRAFSSALF